MIGEIQAKHPSWRVRAHTLLLILAARADVLTLLHMCDTVKSLFAVEYPLVIFQFAIENGPVEIDRNFPIKKWWIFPVRYVKRLPEGCPIIKQPFS